MSRQNENWYVGLSGLCVLKSTDTGAFDPGKGYASPLGLKPADCHKPITETNAKVD
jgi:hypothetical protein